MEEESGPVLEHQAGTMAMSEAGGPIATRQHLHLACRFGIGVGTGLDSVMRGRLRQDAEKLARRRSIDATSKGLDRPYREPAC